MKSLQALSAAALAAATFFVQPALAADTMAAAAAPTAAADPLAAARSLLESRQWAAALTELKRVDARDSADWNNLMGYTLRKSANPDLAASERHYDAALRIDPHHRNALEYSGELYLMKGDLARAQARLAALANECRSGCVQLSELKDALARYQENGNRYMAKGW